MSSINRRDVLKLAGTAGVAATSPWWRVGKSHAQRAKKLVYWHLPNFTPLADQIQKDQVYEFAKQAGLKESEVEYAVVANEPRERQHTVHPGLDQYECEPRLSRTRRSADQHGARTDEDGRGVDGRRRHITSPASAR